MAHIFLSYAREDRAAAEPIARLLAKRGYDVWWDRDIPAGPSYTQVIEQALTAAKCVLVLWSAASRRAGPGRGEEGQERGLLVTVRLADVKPPLGFRGHQLADLADWDGDADDLEFRRVLRGVEALVPRPAQPARQPSPISQPPEAETAHTSGLVVRSPGDATAWRGLVHTLRALLTTRNLLSLALIIAFVILTLSVAPPLFRMFRLHRGALAENSANAAKPTEAPPPSAVVPATGGKSLSPLSIAGRFFVADGQTFRPSLRPHCRS